MTTTKTILPKTDITGSSVSGTFSQSGLFNGGRITDVSVTDAAWAALPAAPLGNRNAISIQNPSGASIKLNYDPLTVGYVGITIASGGERMYVITDSIQVYAKAEAGAGTVTITVEEIS